jgi:hypothetical protein
MTEFYLSSTLNINNEDDDDFKKENYANEGREGKLSISGY